MNFPDTTIHVTYVLHAILTREQYMVPWNVHADKPCDMCVYWYRFYVGGNVRFFRADFLLLKQAKRAVRKKETCFWKALCMFLLLWLTLEWGNARAYLAVGDIKENFSLKSRSQGPWVLSYYHSRSHYEGDRIGNMAAIYHGNLTHALRGCQKYVRHTYAISSAALT